MNKNNRGRMCTFTIVTLSLWGWSSTISMQEYNNLSKDLRENNCKVERVTRFVKNPIWK